MTTIAITGATGQFGQIAVRLLKEKVAADNIIAIVRNAEKAKDLGVNVREADYTEPAKLEAALQGVDKLLLVSGNEVGQRVPQHLNVVAAAKKAGVKHIVYTSLLNAPNSPLSVAVDHPETEAAIKESGLTYTILRNGWYTENYTSSIGAALANGAFYGSAKDGKISSATREDYALAAVTVLTGNGHDNQTYTLVGDTAYTLSDLAAEISRQTGKDIPYVDVPAADYAAALAQAGVPEGFAQMIAGWDVDAAQGALFSEDKTLSKLIGRPTTSLADAVKAALSA